MSVVYNEDQIIALLDYLCNVDSYGPYEYADDPENLRKLIRNYAERTPEKFPKINRVEVIDHYNQKGRALVHWKDDSKIELDYQDGGKTLKVFINKNK